MIEEKSNENAERSRVGYAITPGETIRIHDGSDLNREGTLGQFAGKLRQAARDLLADNPHHDQLRIAGLLQTAATIIENGRPAAAWLKRQPGFDGDGVNERPGYTFAQVVDLLERFAQESQKG